MNKAPTVPACSSAWSPAFSARPGLWLAVVPLDGPPRLEEYREHDEVNQALTQLIEKKETGWVYFFDGVRYPVNFVDTPSVSLRGVNHELRNAQSEEDGVLPGTELYPTYAE